MALEGPSATIAIRRGSNASPSIVTIENGDLSGFEKPIGGVGNDECSALVCLRFRLGHRLRLGRCFGLEQMRSL